MFQALTRAYVFVEHHNDAGPHLIDPGSAVHGRVLVDAALAAIDDFVGPTL